VVGALVKLLDHPGAVGEVFNIGSDEEVSIAELAELVKVLADSRSEIVMVPYHQAYGEGFEDMPRRIPDIAKINALIGFRPTASLEQILQRVIAYYRQKQAAAARPAPGPAETVPALANV
jgi:UDP-glucose 4-epimerase